MVGGEQEKPISRPRVIPPAASIPSNHCHCCSAPAPSNCFPAAAAAFVETAAAFGGHRTDFLDDSLMFIRIHIISFGNQLIIIIIISIIIIILLIIIINIISAGKPPFVLPLF